MDKLSIKTGGMLQYSYRAGGCVDFKFNSLCEVGAPYQQFFRDEIARRGLLVEFNRDTEEKPWVADYVVGKRGCP